MATYSVAHAAEHFESVIAAAERGGEIVLTRDDRPVLKLVSISTAIPKRRTPGRFKGQMKFSDSFWEPTWSDQDIEEWLKQSW